MKWLDQIMLKIAMKYLFRGLNKDDIVLFNSTKTVAISRGRKIPRERMIKMKQEVEYFLHSFLWNDIFEKNIRYTAQELEMKRKDGEFPLGKGMTLTLNTIKQAMRDIQTFKIDKTK